MFKASLLYVSLSRPPVSFRSGYVIIHLTQHANLKDHGGLFEVSLS